MAYQLLEDLFRFISPDEVKVYCGYSQNLRETTILSSIQIAQDLKIKTNLGDILYQKLKEEFILANGNPNNIRDASQSPDGIDYKGLYFQMFPVLVWWTAVYALNDVAIRIEEKGLVYETSDYAENGKLEAFNFKEGRMKSIAEEHTELLICYLETTFPINSIQNTIVQYQEESKEEGTRSSGIFFKKKVGNCNKCL